MSSEYKRLYIVLSQAYFLPGAALAEPFQSEIKWLRTFLFDYKNQDQQPCARRFSEGRDPEEIKKEQDDWKEFLESLFPPVESPEPRDENRLNSLDFLAEMEGWNKAAPFVPGIGKISFHRDSDSTADLILGKEYRDSKSTFWGSAYYHDCFPVPVTIKYHKKISLKPSLLEYCKTHAKARGVGHISQNQRLHIHVFPYGLCFLHLAVSIVSEVPLITEEVISWLRGYKKTAGLHKGQQVSITGDGFIGSITDFFAYIWKKISTKMFISNHQESIHTPLIDSIRVIPDTQIKRENFLEFIDLIDAEYIWSIKKSPYAKEWERWFFKTEGSPIVEKRYNQLPAALRDKELNSYSFFNHTPGWAPKLVLGRIISNNIRAIRKSRAIHLNPQEIAGLLGKNPNFTSLSADEQSHGSKFGKFAGDFFLPKSQSMLFIMNAWSQRLSDQMEHHWRMLATAEIAYAQKLILPYYQKEMASFLAMTERNDKDASQNIPEFPARFLNGLAELGGHLPPHYRKWYHAVQEALSLSSRIQEYQQTSTALENWQHQKENTLMLQDAVGTKGCEKFYMNQPVPIEETRYYEFKEIMGTHAVNAIKNTADEYVVAFLNSGGGRIFWGIRNSDRVVIGVKLSYHDRDVLRRNVTEKLNMIQPAVAPSAYKINIHQVYEAETPVPELFVVEIIVPRPLSNDLYFTSGNEAFMKTDAGKKKLNGPEIQDEIRRRNSSGSRG